MARKLRKIFQPPIDPAARPSERHSMWIGLLLALMAIGFVVTGVLLQRETPTGSRSEWWMVDNARLGVLDQAMKSEPPEDKDFCPT